MIRELRTYVCRMLSLRRFYDGGGLGGHHLSAVHSVQSPVSASSMSQSDCSTCKDTNEIVVQIFTTEEYGGAFYRYLDLDLSLLVHVQSVPDDKHIHSGAEVSICLFSNKFFHAVKIPIGS